MSLIKECWRGERPLGRVFWRYYVTFGFAFVAVLTILLALLVESSLPDVLKTPIMLAGAVLLLAYAIWIMVSIWRCAKLAKPIWRILARLWVILVILGVVANFLIVLPQYQAQLQQSQPDSQNQ